MPQSSGPISQGTASERQFTDVMWRDRFGDEPGVLADMDGSAYTVTLPSDSDVASIGSATQASTATVAGFVHRIPASSPDFLTIPAASGATRTDIISLRYDPAYSGLPGPVRLFRIAGTSSAIPSYDASPPGVEDLPLWAVTRVPGQSLSQATLQRLFPRIAPTVDLPPGASLPISAPLGTIAYQGGDIWRRNLVGTSPVWVKEGGVLPGGWSRTLQRSGGITGGIDQYTNTAMLLGDTWVDAPAGDYKLNIALMLHHPPGPVSGDLIVMIGGQTVSAASARMDVPDYAALMSNFYIRENWPGGNLSYSVQHAVSPGITISMHNPSSKATLEYLGKR